MQQPMVVALMRLNGCETVESTSTQHAGALDPPQEKLRFSHTYGRSYGNQYFLNLHFGSFVCDRRNKPQLQAGKDVVSSVILLGGWRHDPCAPASHTMPREHD